MEKLRKECNNVKERKMKEYLYLVFKVLRTGVQDWRKGNPSSKKTSGKHTFKLIDLNPEQEDKTAYLQDKL